MVIKRDLLGSSVSILLENYRMMVDSYTGFVFGIVDKDTERIFLEKYSEFECFVEFKPIIPEEILEDIDYGVILDEEDVVEVIEGLVLRKPFLITEGVRDNE